MSEERIVSGWCPECGWFMVGRSTCVFCEVNIVDVPTNGGNEDGS